VAYQIGLIMSFLGNSFNQAYTPFLFQRLTSPTSSTKALLSNINISYSLFVFITVIFLYFLTPYIYKYFIGDDFKIDYKIILILLISYGVLNIYKLFVNYLFFYKKTMRLSIITFFSCCVNVFLCYFLIQSYGLFGASVATLVAFSVQLSMVFFEYRKLPKL